MHLHTCSSAYLSYEFALQLNYRRKFFLADDDIWTDSLKLLVAPHGSGGHARWTGSTINILVKRG